MAGADRELRLVGRPAASVSLAGVEARAPDQRKRGRAGERLDLPQPFVAQLHLHAAEARAEQLVAEQQVGEAVEVEVARVGLRAEQMVDDAAVVFETVLAL